MVPRKAGCWAYTRAVQSVVDLVEMMAAQLVSDWAVPRAV